MLKILELGKLKVATIFSPYIIRSLTNIKKLTFYECKELQEVIAKEDYKEEPTNLVQTLFPQLQVLELEGLQNMNRFCHFKNILEFPSLEYVAIKDCHMLETFSLGSLHLPSFRNLNGVSDRDFANKFFFNKEVYK